MKKSHTLAVLLYAVTLLTPYRALAGEFQKSDQLDSVLHTREAANYTFATKFGNLQFIRENGEPGEPAKTIALDGKALVTAAGMTTAQGAPLSLMSEIMTSSSSERAQRVEKRTQPETRRMVILIGEDGNCTRRFMILDFTGAKPFVSKSFGYNPNDQFCLKFLKAKWGKKESTIQLAGPATYIYYTNDEVLGPFAD